MTAAACTTPAAQEQAREARTRFRAGECRPTAGLAPGMTQANLLAVPREYAYDFLLFAQRNPRSCPVLDVTETGSWRTVLAPDADLRTDIPRYRIWEDGELVSEAADAREEWDAHPDLVAFLLGCSFTFESPLQRAGIEVRHISAGTNVPMYRTDVPCRSAGRFHGALVVSMRPIPAGRVAEAAMISGRFPSVHGAPVHVGHPAELGIDDLDEPDFGDRVEIRPGEVPVFWACGVTPQVAVMASRIPFAITHAPGYMFLTDVADARYEV